MMWCGRDFAFPFIQWGHQFLNGRCVLLCSSISSFDGLCFITTFGVLCTSFDIFKSSSKILYGSPDVSTSISLFDSRSPPLFGVSFSFEQIGLTEFEIQLSVSAPAGENPPGWAHLQIQLWPRTCCALRYQMHC